MVVVNQGWQSEATDGLKATEVSSLSLSFSLFLSVLYLSLIIYLPTY